jgi:hypothetical protein
MFYGLYLCFVCIGEIAENKPLFELQQTLLRKHLSLVDGAPPPAFASELLLSEGATRVRRARLHALVAADQVHD